MSSPHGAFPRAHGRGGVFAPRAPPMPPQDAPSREIWRRGLADEWPDLPSVENPPSGLRVWILPWEMREDSSSAVKSAHLISPDDVAHSQQLLREMERFVNCKPSESVHHTRPPPPHTQISDPYNAGFASSSAREWREQWTKRVLQQASLRFSPSTSSPPQKTETLPPLAPSNRSSRATLSFEVKVVAKDPFHLLHLSHCLSDTVQTIDFSLLYIYIYYHFLGESARGRRR